jgi:hypothetical protein
METTNSVHLPLFIAAVDDSSRTLFIGFIDGRRLIGHE